MSDAPKLKFQIAYEAYEVDEGRFFSMSGLRGDKPWTLVATGYVTTRGQGAEFESYGKLLVEQTTGIPAMTDVTTLLCALWCVERIEVTFAVGLTPPDEQQPCATCGDPVGPDDWVICQRCRHPVCPNCLHTRSEAVIPLCKACAERYDAGDQ